jgi:hypothetical protein
LSNPGQRAIYDGSLPVARPERFETKLYQFREWRTELDSLALTPTSQPQLKSVQVHPVTAAAPPPSLGPRQFHLGRPRVKPARFRMHGSFDLPNSKSPLSLLAREEAAEIQRQLIDVLKSRHVLVGGDVLSEVPGQHELRFEHGAIVGHDSVQGCPHALELGVA